MKLKPLDAAIHIAREAGKYQLSRLNTGVKVEHRGVINLVTEVDRACEKMIVDYLHENFPDHDFLAEEGSNTASSADYKWIIDPLDGTTNFAHGYPLFCVCIALEYRGEVILGVVYEPNRNEMFVAEKGKGAACNGRPIYVSKSAILRESLLSTGFAYNIQEGEKMNNLDHFQKFLMKTRAVRRDGVAGVDLCYLACGRFDGFWELYLKPWDIAAGALMVREAGGAVTAFDGSAFNVYGDEILATNGLIHDEMRDVLSPPLPLGEREG